VLVTLFIFVLFGFTALSIDVANVYREKHKAHDATDAAALAGVAKLGPSGNATAAITEADVIAKTNGVTNAEITSSNTGTIQVGSWDGTAFTANTPPYNAVRVPAQRTVTNNFGRVVGFPVMTPVVDSIATIGAINIPFGVEASALPNTFPTDVTVSSASAGNWGALDECGTLSGSGDKTTAIGGGGCFASIGTVTGQSSGIDGVCAGFSAQVGRTVVLPVVDSFANGNGSTKIVNFIVVQVLSTSKCNGSNWTADITILGEGFSALQQYGLGPVRSLVE